MADGARRLEARNLGAGGGFSYRERPLHEVHCPSDGRFLTKATSLENAHLRCKSCGTRYVFSLSEEGRLTVDVIEVDTLTLTP